jgi:hypothetical protein
MPFMIFEMIEKEAKLLWLLVGWKHLSEIMPGE